MLSFTQEVHTAVQMSAALRESDLQTLHIEHLSRHLQLHPPQQPLPAIARETSHQDVQAAADLSEESRTGDNMHFASMDLSSSAADVKKKKPQAPCRYACLDFGAQERDLEEI